MKKFLFLAPLALLAIPMAAPSASAETVVVKERRHVDNGLHRGWRNGHAYGARKVTVRREVRRGGPVTVTKKVTRTNAMGDRVTRKVTRTVD